MCLRPETGRSDRRGHCGRDDEEHRPALRNRRDRAAETRFDQFCHGIPASHRHLRHPSRPEYGPHGEIHPRRQNQQRDPRFRGAPARYQDLQRAQCDERDDGRRYLEDGLLRLFIYLQRQGRGSADCPQESFRHGHARRKSDHLRRRAQGAAQSHRPGYPGLQGTSGQF